MVEETLEEPEHPVEGVVACLEEEVWTVAFAVEAFDLVAVADPARLVVHPSAWVGTPYLEEVVGEVEEDQHLHLQKVVEALEHPWYHWTEDHWQVLGGH